MCIRDRLQAVVASELDSWSLHRVRLRHRRDRPRRLWAPLLPPRPVTRPVASCRSRARPPEVRLPPQRGK
eukprot:1855780-Pyramimonas_sp.AAC.1